VVSRFISFILSRVAMFVFWVVTSCEFVGRLQHFRHSVSIMTSNHTKTKVGPTFQTSCKPVSSIHQTMENFQHNIGIMDQALTQAFRESRLDSSSVS
jgi:hypothetical protein